MEKTVVNKLYAHVENVGINRELSTVLTPVFCGFHGELNSITKYSRYSLISAGKHKEELEHVFAEIASDETMHFKLLAKLMYRLGADPFDYAFKAIGDKRFTDCNVKHVCAPEKMITDSIIYEISSINEYEKIMAKVQNDYIKQIIDYIILDERKHLKKLREFSSLYRIKFF